MRTTAAANPNKKPHPKRGDVFCVVTVSVSISVPVSVTSSEFEFAVSSTISNVPAISDVLSASASTTTSVFVSFTVSVAASTGMAGGVGSSQTSVSISGEMVCTSLLVGISISSDSDSIAASSSSERLSESSNASNASNGALTCAARSFAGTNETRLCSGISISFPEFTSTLLRDSTLISLNVPSPFYFDWFACFKAGSNQTEQLF